MSIKILGGSPWLLLFLFLVEGGILLTFTILWFLSMRRAMAACHPVSRGAEPDTVWLNFIPVFGLFWQFICVSRISDSLAREYHRRGWHSDENNPALELGIVAGVVICVCALLRSFIPLHPGIGFFMTLAMCLCMYRHSDRLNSYRERMEKELDPTTAFGQIPVMQQIVATAFQSKQQLPVTPESLAEQLRSSYTNIPFVPQTPFVSPENNIPFVPQTPFVPPQNNVTPPPKQSTNLSSWMPPVTDSKNEHSAQEKNNSGDNADQSNRWAPPKP
ncbi:MAG: hypothetical protein M3R17_03090 [Bacteroidota bacterium]|nr:hypothetical protein [Bacteroidota bacterium]